MVAKSSSDEVWALQEAVLSGDPKRTAQVLHEVLDIGRKSTVPAFWCLIDLARKLATLSINAERGVDPWSLSRALKLWGAAQGPTLNVGARINPDLAAQLHREALDAQLAPNPPLKSSPGKFENWKELTLLEKFYCLESLQIHLKSNTPLHQQS